MANIGPSPTYTGPDGREYDAQGVFSASPPASVVVGRQGVTATSTALPVATLVNGVVIKALDGNAAGCEVLTGSQTAGQRYPLAAGDAVSFAVSGLSALKVVGTPGDGVAWAGS